MGRNEVTDFAARQPDDDDQHRETAMQIDPRDPYFHFNVVQHQAVADWALENRQVRTTAGRVKKATESGELEYAIVSGKRAYSGAAIDKWLLSLRRTVNRKTPGSSIVMLSMAFAAAFMVSTDTSFGLMSIPDFYRKIVGKSTAMDLDEITPKPGGNLAHFEQVQAAKSLAEKHIEELATDLESPVVVARRGTPYAIDRVNEALQRCGLGKFEHYRAGRSEPPDRAPTHLRHIGPNGEFKPKTDAATGFGVLHPTRTGRIYELQPGFRLPEVLNRIEQGSFAACEMPESVSIVGGGSAECSGHATGFLLSPLPERWLILVWRACDACRAYIERNNAQRSNAAEPNSRYVDKAHAERVSTALGLPWPGGEQS